MSEDGDRPPDRVKAETDPESAIQALERAETVTVWDLPSDYNTLSSIASRVGVEPERRTRAKLESALAEYFTDDADATD